MAWPLPARSPEGRSARESETMTQHRQGALWLLRIVCQCEVRYRPVHEATALHAELTRVSNLTCPVCAKQYYAFLISERRMTQSGPPRGGERRRDALRDVQATSEVARRRAASVS